VGYINAIQLQITIENTVFLDENFLGLQGFQKVRADGLIALEITILNRFSLFQLILKAVTFPYKQY